MMDRYIVGISAFYHDSAACIVRNGRVIAAAQEERFSRVKHDASFPKNALLFCLDYVGISHNEIDFVVFYEKPFLKFERLLETYFSVAPRGLHSFIRAMPIWLKEKLFLKANIVKTLENTFGGDIRWEEKLLFSEHHGAHAASAFYPSPFKSAAVLTLDGVGEWATSTLTVGNDNNLRTVKELRFPHSLGLLYSAFTYYLGFKINSGEYKLMGLAPYGEPLYAQKIKDHLVSIADDGTFKLNMKYFGFATDLKMTNTKFHELFGGPPRKNRDLTQRDMDIAASVQKVLEDIVILIARDVARTTNQKNLCLAGGVALNCVVNGALKRSKIFEKIWIQPAAGDAGGAIGAALLVWFEMLGNPRVTTSTSDSMNASLLGPELTNEVIRVELERLNAVYTEHSEDLLIEQVAQAISESKAIGWIQGRMEFGPRALGARSILADPRSPIMQQQLNLKVKNRESFRPFAPSILEEYVSEWFDFEGESPYMLFVAAVKMEQRLQVAEMDKKLKGIELLNVPRSTIPAVTHIDYSARLQTVSQRDQPKFHKLISKFKEITGCPLLVNTSFNVRGEPIVCSVDDAFSCFMATELDCLAIGNFLIQKADQTHLDRSRFEKYFEED